MTYLTHLIKTLLEYVRGAKTMMFHIDKTFHVEQGKPEKLGSVEVGECGSVEVREDRKTMEPQKDTHVGYDGHKSLAAKNAENTEKRR